MDWHRDSYLNQGKILGDFPPPIKLIFYPNEGALKIIPGSHTLQLHSDQSFASLQGSTVNLFDRQILSTIQPFVFKSTGKTSLLFNTAALHGAIPTQGEEQYRLIYSFKHKSQFKGSGELHEKTARAL